MKKLSLIIITILFLITPHTIQSQSGIPFTPENATWIVQLNQIGDGYLNEFTYSPDAQTIVFAGS
ncbi:MAG TPA: hypothetical protein PLZ51_14900, partial [Aggregatilineales bacterium]|nr:hypothetical protein [Aggregatilineales bacterium]